MRTNATSVVRAAIALPLLTGISTEECCAQTPIRVSVKRAGTSEVPLGAPLVSDYAAGATINLDIAVIEGQYPNFEFLRIDDTTNSGQVIGVVSVANGASRSSDVSVMIADPTYGAFPALSHDPLLDNSFAGGALIGVTIDANSTNVRLAAVVTGDIGTPTSGVTVGEADGPARGAPARGWRTQDGDGGSGGRAHRRDEQHHDAVVDDACSASPAQEGSPGQWRLGERRRRAAPAAANPAIAHAPAGAGIGCANVK